MGPILRSLPANTNEFSDCSGMSLVFVGSIRTVMPRNVGKNTGFKPLWEGYSECDLQSLYFPSECSEIMDITCGI